MKRIVLAAAAAALAVGGAAEAASKKTKEDVLKMYERTGEMENCIGLQRIDHSEVIDDQTILFHMRGGTVYLNELPYRCPQLGFYKSYTYSTSINRLCNTEIITVLDTAVRQRLASCGLGKFEKLTPIPEEEMDDE